MQNMSCWNEHVLTRKIRSRPQVVALSEDHKPENDEETAGPAATFRRGFGSAASPAPEKGGGAPRAGRHSAVFLCAECICAAAALVV